MTEGNAAGTVACGEGFVTEDMAEPPVGPVACEVGGGLGLS